MKRFLPWLACCAVLAAAQNPARTSPYKDARQPAPVFSGPADAAVDPASVREVLIGYYGPSAATNPESAAWRGAQRAIDEANRQGGYRGKPFRLIAAWSEDPWRGGAAQITRMAFVDRVWAIVTGADGTGVHLAEQVVVKALLPLVNARATDRSIHMAGVPWMFSIAPGDDRLASALEGALRDRSIAIVSATDHDSRAFTRYLESHARAAHADVKRRLQFDAAQSDLRSLVRDAVEADAEAIVVVAPPRESAEVVGLLRAAPYSGAVIGGPQFGSRAFLDGAGKAAEGVVFPSTAPVETRDTSESAGFDATRVVIDAIRAAGLARAGIRDAIAARSPAQGESGRIEWDQYGQNARRPALMTIRSGNVIPSNLK